MPLYVADEVIQNYFGVKVGDALMSIKREMSDKAVPPSMALRLIKVHLVPLLPAKHRDVMDRVKSSSWNAIHWLFVAIAFKSGRSTGTTIEIAKAVNLIWEHTIYPPRELLFPETVEIQYFIQTSKNLGVDVEHLRYQNDRAIDIFRGCKYCWRQPVPGRSICIFHTAGEKHISQNKDYDNIEKVLSPATLYKEGRRQRLVYEDRISEILSREILDLYNSEMQSQFLIPSENIWEWLSSRRPYLTDLLVKSKLDYSDKKIINSLITLLNTPQGLPTTLLIPYIKTNEAINIQPVLIFPMLLRAEAWLSSRSFFRSNWGGTRYPQNFSNQYNS